MLKTSFCRAKCTMFAASSFAQSICQILFLTFSIEEEKINTRRFPSPLPKKCSHFVSCPQLPKASRRGFSRIRNNPQYERAITIIQTRTGKRFLSYTVCPISRVPSQPVRSSQLSATTITFEYHPLEGKVRIVFSCSGNKKLLTFDA